MLARSALAIITAFVTGCSTLNEFRVEGDQDRQKVRFSGIKQLVEIHRHVDVLFIHGMGGYSHPDRKKYPEDPQPLIDRIKQAHPRFKIISSQDHTLVYRGKPIGLLKETRTRSEDGKHSIHYFVLYWKRNVIAHKQILGEDEKPGARQHRLKLINTIKKGLMNTNLADVALYLGKYKKAMQRPIRASLVLMDKIRRNRQSAQVLITWSLGSTMVFDTLNLMQSGPRANQKIGLVARRFRNRTRLFFMLANQIPIIHLSEVPSDPDGRRKARRLRPDPCANLLPSLRAICRFAHRPQKRIARPLPWIIAISDPNDLLSYAVFEKLRELQPNTFVTVYTSVSKTAWWTPWGKITMPHKAHTHYGIDKRTTELILGGYGVN